MVAPAKTRRGSYSVGIARKARIIEIATEEFARGGFYNTSLTKIAEAASLTDAGLTHHFGNKQLLLLAVIEQRHNEARQWWEQFEEIDAVSYLRALPQGAARDLTQPGLIELFVTLAAEAAHPSHPAHVFFVDRYNETISSITHKLQQGIAAGHLRSDTPAAKIAAEILAVLDGLQLQWMLSERKSDLVGATRLYADRLARQITVDGRGLD